MDLGFDRVEQFFCSILTYSSITQKNTENPVSKNIMMMVFVRLLHPYVVFLLITLHLGNEILYTK